MADKPQTTRKRRLRTPTETVRERQTNAQAHTTSARGRIRTLLRPLGWPFRKLAALSIWQSKFWKPFRFVGRWIGLILLPPYLRNSWRELKLVTWPNWKESWRLTWAVLIFSIIFGVVIAVVDFGLDKLFKEVLVK